MTSDSINSFFESDNPLTTEAFEYIVNYKEEDIRIDYKEDFDPSVGSQWLGITKDIVAFANTLGGYLCFGIRDKTYKLIGLKENIVTELTDTNKIIQKINKYIRPPIDKLRTKAFTKNELKFVLIFIPPSKDKTHFIAKNATFNYPSGTKKTILHEGTFYIRQSGGNKLGDSHSLDEIITRRMSYFRDSLLKNISRVMEAPPNTEIKFVRKDVADDSAERIVLSDSPDATPVKGISSTISPSSIEEEIATWLSLLKLDSSVPLSPKFLWKWYSKRSTITLSKQYRLKLSKYYIMGDAPVFYWLRGCKASSIKEMILESIDLLPLGQQVGYPIRVAAFLGRGFFNKAIERLKKRKSKLRKGLMQFPSAGPDSNFMLEIIGAYKNHLLNYTDKEIEQKVLKDLNIIADSVISTGKDEPSVMKRSWAQTYDCYLYAQNNKYRE